MFIAGFSMGGFFTNSLACAHSDWFRAFAPVSGGGPGSWCVGNWNHTISSTAAANIWSFFDGFK